MRPLSLLAATAAAAFVAFAASAAPTPVPQPIALAVADPGRPDHGLDLAAMARRFAQAFRREKAERREVGADGARAIPGVNHPVFRGKPVNLDPREVFVVELMEQAGEHNVFHDFYRAVVQALFEQAVTSNVFCVNIDAVIAAWLLKLLWRPYQSGEIDAATLETAAFTLFLLARMAGSAAEIEDHLNRGRNMDTRTPASQCRFVC
jgi:citrate synthase